MATTENTLLSSTHINFSLKDCDQVVICCRDIRPCTLDKGQEACRLRFYELYAWGGPLLIAGVAAVSDHLPGDAYPNLLKPRFGEKRCWFYGKPTIVSECENTAWIPEKVLYPPRSCIHPRHV